MRSVVACILAIAEANIDLQQENASSHMKPGMGCNGKIDALSKMRQKQLLHRVNAASELVLMRLLMRSFLYLRHKDRMC